MKEKFDLFSCPAFIHDSKTYESSWPCWGKLTRKHNVLTCEKCKSEFPIRETWPFPIIIPNYDKLVEGQKDDFKDIEQVNFSSLKLPDDALYKTLKQIPAPEFKKNIIGKLKEEWKDYFKKVAKKIGLESVILYNKRGEGDIGILENDKKAHVYDAIVEIDNYDAFFEYYLPLFKYPDLMSEYIIACLLHELGHLAPPSTGCIEMLFCETDHSRNYNKINLHRNKSLICWDESSANLNALEFYPDYESCIRFIALSVYAGKRLFKSENQCKKNDEVLIKEIGKNSFISNKGVIKKIIEVSGDYPIVKSNLPAIMNYMENFLWYDLQKKPHIRRLFDSISKIHR